MKGSKFSRLKKALAAAVASWIAVSVPVTAEAEADRQWAFRVFLDDREIGHHRVRLTTLAEGARVSTEVNFDVKFLFVSAFRYDHRSDETWQGACLSGIDARTSQNGEEQFVRGEANPDGITLRTVEGERQLQGCVRSFAYWDPELLRAERLLNTQTGAYQPVEVKELGDERFEAGGREIPARKYRLLVDSAAVDLWYTRDLTWLALETTTKEGYRLRYLPSGEVM